MTFSLPKASHIHTSRQRFVLAVAFLLPLTFPAGTVFGPKKKKSAVVRLAIETHCQICMYSSTRRPTIGGGSQVRSKCCHNCHIHTCVRVCVRASVCAMVVAARGCRRYVAILTTIAAAVMSWHHYVDVQRKMVRYTNTIFHLKNVQTWWRSLHDVERTTVEVNQAEDGVAWFSLSHVSSSLALHLPSVLVLRCRLYGGGLLRPQY